MTEMELKSRRMEIKKQIEEGFAKKYPSAERNGKVFFTTQNGEEVSVVCVPIDANDPFFVVEYENGDDGCNFYPSDYENLEDMIQDMIAEVEDSGEG